MKEKPMLFSGPMVRALLEGRKTQTRRIVKPQPKIDSCGAMYEGWRRKSFQSPAGTSHYFGDMNHERFLKWFATSEFCPHNVGSRIWVKETWGPCDGGVCYRASEKPTVKPDGGKWKPSIFMPRWASRITLEVTAVRVEKLQQINNEDAKAEGIPHAAPHRHGTQGIVKEWHPGEITPDPYADRHNTGVNDCWICAYRDLWQEINGPGSWDKNPWVWVYTLKMITA